MLSGAASSMEESPGTLNGSVGEAFSVLIPSGTEMSSNLLSLYREPATRSVRCFSQIPETATSYPMSDVRSGLLSWWKNVEEMMLP